MKFDSLSPHVLLAHWVPGFLVFMALRPLLDSSTFPEAFRNLAGDNSSEALRIVAISVAAFVLGEFLDAIRDLLEHFYDRFQRVDWESRFIGEKEKIESFKNAYFTYYVFGHNASFAFLVIFALSFTTPNPWWARLTIAVFFLVFALSAKSLRKEMARITGR